MGNNVYASQLPSTKSTIRMANAKVFWFLVDLLGIPSTILGIWLNLDNIKSAIIAILAIIYLMVRLYFYFIKSRLDVKEKELDIWVKEQDKRDRISSKN